MVRLLASIVRLSSNNFIQNHHQSAVFRRNFASNDINVLSKPIIHGSSTFFESNIGFSPAQAHHFFTWSNKPNENIQPKSFKANSIHDFFAKFPDFNYNKSNHYLEEYRRFIEWYPAQPTLAKAKTLYKEAQEGSREPQKGDREAVSHFFRHDFPNFPYNEKADIGSEFERLRVFMHWPSDKEINRPRAKKTKEQRARETIYRAAICLFNLAKKRMSSTPTEKEVNERMADFFSRMFPGFGYDSKKGHAAEFKRACRSKKWMGPDAKGPISMKTIRKEFRKAQILAFGELFGKSDMDRANWVRLFGALGIKDVPQEIVDCKEKMLLYYFNLVDVVNNQRYPEAQPNKHYDMLKELRKYTKEKGYFFPNPSGAKWAEDQELLRWLLREITRAYNGWRVSGEVEENEARVKAETAEKERKAKEEKNKKDKEKDSK